MSDRVVKEWVKDTETAFGKSAKNDRGNLAESLYFQHASEKYFNVIDHAENQDMQNCGIDFEIFETEDSKSFGVDVKSTLNGSGFFVIENSSKGWLRNPKKTNKYVVHLNVTDKRAIEYERESMIEYLNKVVRSKDELVYLQIDDFDFEPAENSILKYKRYWI